MIPSELLTYFSYPTEEEWVANYNETVESFGGKLPLGDLSVNFIRIMNTIGSSLLMVAMGLATNPSDLVQSLKCPMQCLLGILCQFIAMPVTGIILIYALPEVHPFEALALYLFALSPGGGTSNLMCYYMDLNLELSVTLTTLCTVAAFGLMPAYLDMVKIRIKLNTPRWTIGHNGD